MKELEINSVGLQYFQRGTEEGIGAFGTGVTRGSKLQCGPGNQTQVLGKKSVALTIELIFLNCMISISTILVLLILSC